MSTSTVVGIDAEKLLGNVTLEVLDLLRGGTSRGDGGDILTQVLARHALMPPVVGCVLAVVDQPESFRAAGAAGATGKVTLGSRWPLSGSVVSEALAQRHGGIAEVPLDQTGAGRALREAGATTVLTLPLRVGDRGRGEPTSLGAMVLLAERSKTLGDTERRFFDGLGSLASLVILDAGPAHDWARRASILRRSVDVAVDAAGSLDALAIPRVLRRACEAVDADRATLLRLSGGAVIVEGVHDINGVATETGYSVPVADRPALVEALESGNAVASGRTDVSGLSVHAREAYSDVCHSLVLPLVLGDEVAGFLSVARRQPRPFMADDATALEFLGQVAILALRNSRLYSEAQAASSAMSAFLRLIVHDLRAPLTVLSGYVDLLRDGTFGQGPLAWEKPMATIASKIHETQRLVDDLLVAARLESGAIACHPERLDLNEVVARAAERAEPRTLLAHGSIETMLAPRPAQVHADGFHVDRIIDNLVNNAINYGGEAPRVRLSVDPTTPPAVRVEDSGVGISQELHERIFEPFFRVDNRVPGTGFGLHVGRVLANACGGSLRLERSEPDVGSTFRLELPEAPHSDPASASSLTGSPAPPRNRN